LRRWAPDCYSYLAVVGPMLGIPAATASDAAAVAGSQATGGRRGAPQASGVSSLGSCGPRGSGQPSLKHRFCASYPNIAACRRGEACAFAHSRDEVETPLLSVEEEEHVGSALTEAFFTGKFKTLWCPIGAQHDWQSCAYAHTYQDARRKPSIGYGPQPCPYWSKKDTRASYSQRCPLGLRCPYSHGAKEQLYHPKYFRTVTCRDLQQRGCPRQQLCAFYHKRQERRQVGTDGVDYSKPLSKQAIPEDWAATFSTPPFFQETGELEQVATAIPPPAAGAWDLGFGGQFMGMAMALKKMQDSGGAASSSLTATASAMPATEDGHAATGYEESPRTQSTAVDSTELAAQGRGGSQDWYQGSDAANYFAPCYANGDGSAFNGFPAMFARGPAAAAMQSSWWGAEEAGGGG